MENEPESDTQGTKPQKTVDKRNAGTTTDIQLVPDFFQKEYSNCQAVDLTDHYQCYVAWLQEQGKNPDENEGLAPSNVPIVFSRTIQFHRRVWERNGLYTTQFTHEHSDLFEQDLNADNIRQDSGEPYSESSKRKMQEVIVKYFLWRACIKGGTLWKPNLTFQQTDYSQADYLTLEERSALYGATLTYDDFGRYDDLSPEVRERRKSLLAQKLVKPKAEVTPDDFERCQISWKISSLISASLDLGPRPKLIEKCLLKWYKPAKGEFQIPKEGAVKNDHYWNCAVSSRTMRLLSRWKKQRSTLPKYAESDRTWLNREGNSYSSTSLNYLLRNLLEEAGIEQADRQLVWTSIRRSTATYLAHLENLQYAKEQLRHNSLQSTLRYVEVPVKFCRNTLDLLAGISESGSTLKGEYQLSEKSSTPLGGAPKMTSTHLSVAGHKCGWYLAIAGSRFPPTNQNWGFRSVGYQKIERLVKGKLLSKSFKEVRIRSPIGERILSFLMKVGQTLKAVSISLVVTIAVQVHWVGMIFIYMTPSLPFLLVVGIAVVRSDKTVFERRCEE